MIKFILYLKQRYNNKYSCSPLFRGYNMIGRKNEINELNRIYDRNKAELVAIYGRRRVGKTFLVDETFSGKITFRHAGLSPENETSKGLLKLQLDHFYNSLDIYGMIKCKRPIIRWKTFIVAFQDLLTMACLRSWGS